MRNVNAPQVCFREQLVGVLRDLPHDSLCVIERREGEVLLHQGKEGEFLTWTQTHGESFRRYALRLTDWTDRDRMKFLPLERSLRVRFYVRIEHGEMVVYPPRNL